MRSFWLLILLVSCAQVTTIGEKKHQFGKRPVKIVWLQIPGLSYDILPLIKFKSSVENTKLKFEDFICKGTTWEYSTDTLRPGVFDSLQMQNTGRLETVKKCQDDKKFLRPFWKYLEKDNYRIGILEGEFDKEHSYDKVYQCQPEDFSNVAIWKTSSFKDAELNVSERKFHRSQKNEFQKGIIKFDRACDNDDDCTDYWNNNLKTLYFQHFVNQKSYFYIYQDFKLYNLLNEKEVPVEKVKSYLEKLEEIVAFFNEETSKNPNLLFLVSSPTQSNFDLPKQGLDWKGFQEGIDWKATKTKRLNGSVYASGAGAENFCGSYHQTEIIRKIFSKKNRGSYEFIIINPFKD